MREGRLYVEDMQRHQRLGQIKRNIAKFREELQRLRERKGVNFEPQEELLEEYAIGLE